MTTDEINDLLAKRDRIAVRYAYRTHQLDQIDRKLRAVPAGHDNRVDLALGRMCAQLPPRTDADYRRMCEGRPDGIVEHDDALMGAWK